MHNGTENGPTDPQPLQIMDFEQNEDPGMPRVLKLHKDNLSKILQQAGERRVAIIAIAGPSRKGKSFFLGFIIRYLEALEKDESDWMDWDNKDKPLTGFKWRSGIEHETSGILMWSKPFIVTANGSQIAIILMDTQGTYDEYTTPREMNAVVGLSLLSSSCLIFNFFTELQEDVLTSLDTYIKYGQLALGQDENAMETDEEHIRPFQKLMFLIRDWNVPSQFPYGAKGGKSFLQRKLEVKPDQPEQTKQIRVNLKQCFETLDCFLMPNPGDKAMLEGFDGSLSQLSSNFAKKLEELTNDLLNPDELPLKSIFGSEVFAVDMINYFEKYVTIFNGDEMPVPTTIMEATANISNSNLVNKLTRNYIETMKKKQRGKKFMSDSALKKIHKSSGDEALKEFKNTRKLGDKDLIESYEADLMYKIKEAFYKIENDNSVKRTRLVENAVFDSVKDYREAIQEEFEDEDSFLEERRLKSVSETSKKNISDEFKEKISEEDEKGLEKAKKSLEIKLEGEEEKVLLDNRNRRMKAEKKMVDLVNSTCKLYRDEMDANLEDDEFMSEEQLSEYDEEFRHEFKERFNKAKKVGSKDFLKAYSQQLESSLGKEFDDIQKSYRLRIQEAEQSVDGLLDETLTEFVTCCRAEVEEMMDDGSYDMLDDKQVALVSETEKSILAKSQIPATSKLWKRLVAEINSKLQTTFQSVVKDVIQAKKDCEESYRKAVEEGYVVYAQDMDNFVLTDAFHDEDVLQEKHDEFQPKAVTTYNAYSKEGIHPTPDQFYDELESKINAHFKKTWELNVERKDKAQAEAKNVCHDAHGEYQSEMLSKLEIARDEAQFQDFHLDATKAAIETFKTKCNVKNPSFIAPFIELLETDIKTTFEDELKEVFELKLLERDSGTKTATADARKLYKEEMAKHYNNTEFMRPKDLEELHERMSKLAIQKCEEKTPLSAIQKAELEAALLLTYESYREENDMNVPVDPAIGIDLGTTYSCVGVYLKGKVHIIPNAQGKNTTPSYVSYNKSYAESVGIPAKEKAYENAENTIYDAKRIIGRKFEDPILQNDMKFWPFKVVNEKDVPKIEINGKTFHPEQISSEVLKEMRVIAEKHLNCEIKNAVITVPAYFTDGQRQATIDAGTLAGLKVLNILTEPVSAAVAYKLQHTDDDTRHVLTFDLGGGTFDVAVLKMSKEKIETLGVGGDTHLGGEDFDQNVMKYCALEFQRLHGIDLMEGKDSTTDLRQRQEVRRRLKRLQLECERRKIELASCRSVDIAVDGIYNEGGVSTDLKVNLTREKFEELNEDLLEKTIQIVEKCLVDAKLDKSKIDDIVLVGGSTRIPKVQELLTDYFEGRALNKTVNPDEAVAYGAAVQAAIMNGQIAKESIDFNKIQDVTPMSLGIEVYGGGFSIIISKNSKVPRKIQEQYRTAHNNQTSVLITIYQGEDPVAKNNSWLGEFYLNGIPPADAGRETIDVTMEINLQGVLHVTAVCTSTGDTDSIKVTEHKRRMGSDQIKRILAEAKPGGA